MTKNSTLNIIKSETRQEVLRLRNSLKTSKRQEYSRNAIANFMGNIPLESSDKIACFKPIQSEIDINFLLEVLLEEGYEVCLPFVVTKNQPLLFKKYFVGMDLVYNPQYKIYEPPVTSQNIDPTIMVIPMIACDVRGNRIGYGGGFYDRTISKLKKIDILTVGMVYDFQVIKKIPVASHDQKIDCIVTDKRVIICE